MMLFVTTSVAAVCIYGNHVLYTSAVDHIQTITQIQIKSFVILAVLRRSVYRVCRPHLRVIVPCQQSSFQRNVAAVASSGQLSVRFNRPEIRTSALRSPDKRGTARPNGW